MIRLLTADVFRDGRGWLTVPYDKTRAATQNAVLGQEMKLCVRSFSLQNTLRGLHYQYPVYQGKLVSLLSGHVFGVAVDVMPGSPRLGEHETYELRGLSGTSVWVPAGYAHGFYALEDSVVEYLCTEAYFPTQKHVLAWDDPDVGIEWPLLMEYPVLSEDDSRGLRLGDLR